MKWRRSELKINCSSTGSGQSDYDLWADDLTWWCWIGPQMQYHGRAIEDAYKLSEWTRWMRSNDGPVSEL